MPTTVLPFIVTKFDCLNYGGEWINKVLNFDTTPHAIILLFAMSLADWVYQMYNIVDATEVGLQPKLNQNQLWELAIVGFVFLFTFFLLNLFIGVVVSTFNEQREQHGKDFLLTQTQKSWLNMKVKLLNTKPVIVRQISKQGFVVKRVCFYLSK